MKSTLLASAATELLYVDRYIDSGQDFYESVKDYYDDIQAINTQITDWKAYPQQTELWLYEEKPIHEGNVTTLIENLKKAMCEEITNNPT